MRLLIALALVLIVPTSAVAQADIEGVWSFSGGQVVVRAQPDGTFLGTVIRPTRFSRCAHPTGERMWTGVVAQPDGQYFGKHQYYSIIDCAPLPDLGNAAFRVLTKPDGVRFLRLCATNPELPGFQPTIAPDGTATAASDGCFDSDLVSPLPAGRPKIEQIATLPKQGKRKCLSRRSFTIRLREPSGDALKSAVVFLNGKRIQARRGERLTAPINLKGLPKGRYTVKIVARTVLGKTIQGKRKYRTCARKRRGGNKGPL